jgi:apolipoprotein N-acyltransferase
MRWFLVLLSSFLFFLSFPSIKGIDTSWLSYFSLVPVLLAIRGEGYKKVFWYGFWFWFVGYFLLLEWIQDFARTIFTVFPTVLLMAFPMAFFFLCYEYIAREYNINRLLLFPSLGIFFEWVLSYSTLLAGISFVITAFLVKQSGKKESEEGMRLLIKANALFVGIMLIFLITLYIHPLAFPWAIFGNTQFRNIYLIQIASIGGVFLVSGFLYLWNVFLSELIYTVFFLEKKGIYLWVRKRVIWIVGISIFVYVFGFFRYKDVSGDVPVAIIQCKINPWKSWFKNREKFMDKLFYMSKIAMKFSPKLLVWTESSTLEYFRYNISHRYSSPDRLGVKIADKVINFASKEDVDIITGCLDLEIERHNGKYRRYIYNASLLFGREGKIIGVYRKHILVPFGETNPYRWLTPKFLEDFRRSRGGSNFSSGKEYTIFSRDYLSFATTICYEAIFPNFIGEFISRGANVIINLTNDGWTDSYKGHWQHFAPNVFRAVENGVFYIRSANDGISAIISPYGKVERYLDFGKEGILFGKVSNVRIETVYSLVGDIWVFVWGIFIFLVFFYKAQVEAKRDELFPSDKS